MITIVLADDHKVMRQGLRALLDDQADFRVVGEASDETTVVVLSMYGTEGYVHKAMRAGAKAYVLKDASADELATAIRQAASGQRYLSRRLSEHAIDMYIKDMMPEPHELDMSLLLTTREHEILQRIAQGKKNKEIATELSISPRTIEFHRANIMRKLGIHSQQELFRYCARTGILQKEP